MLLVRRYTLLAAIALCVPVSARAHPAPAETGLLLGMSDGRTYWIPRDSTGFRLGTTVNQLVVPRADGWWFVASETRCGLDIDGAHGGGGIAYSLAFVDAVASPSGAYAALILPNEIRCQHVRAGGLAEPAGATQAIDHAPPVMIRWATHEEAARWTREIPRLAPPVARVEGPKYGSPQR